MPRAGSLPMSLQAPSAGVILQTPQTEHLSDCPNLGGTYRSSAQFCVDQWELSPELGHSERQLKEKKSWRKEKKSPSQSLKSEENASKTYPEVS